MRKKELVFLIMKWNLHQVGPLQVQIQEAVRMNHSRILVFFLSICLAGGLTAQEQGPRTVSIPDFEANGITAEEAATLTQRFRSELDRTGTFTGIPFSQIDGLLNEEKLAAPTSLSGKDLKMIGEALGVELMLVGSIGKLGATYTIDLRVFDVASAVLIGSYSLDHKGEIDGLLTKFTLLAADVASGGNPKTVAIENQQKPFEQVPPQPPQGSQLDKSPLAIRLRAVSDADADFNQKRWLGYGGTAGCLTEMIAPPLGRLLGTIGIVVGARLAKSDLPPERITQLDNYDAANQALYLKTYQKEMKRLRRKTGGQASIGGCCVGLMILASLSAAGT